MSGPVDLAVTFRHETGFGQDRPSVTLRSTMVITESLPISSLVLDSRSQMALWVIADRMKNWKNWPQLTR
jgi:hypothetical protein